MTNQEHGPSRLVASRRLREKTAMHLGTPDPDPQPSGNRTRVVTSLQLFALAMAGLGFMLIVGLVILFGSGRRAPSQPTRINMPLAAVMKQAPSSAAVAFAPPTSGAVIAGTVVYTGQPVTPRALRTSADPMCTVPVLTENLVVNADGSLRNVLVYVKQGLENRLNAPPATPSLMEARGFRIAPHVLAVQVGQPVNFHNADPSAINWRVAATRNVPSNYGQPKTGMIFTQTFNTPEIAISVHDDVHPWKSGYICVISHPFFNVTHAAGVFRLDGLPPGTYVIGSWHEKLGTTQQTVTVEAGGVAKITIRY